MRELTCAFYTTAALAVAHILVMYAISLLPGGAWQVMLPSLWWNISLNLKYYFKMQQLKQSLDKENDNEHPH